MCNGAAPAAFGNNITGEPGKTMASALTGATISRAEVFVYASSWRAKKDNRLYLQAWSGSSLPSTHTSSPNLSDRWLFDYAGAGVGQWMTIPSSWVSASSRGVQVGPLDGLAALVPGTSGNFAGATWSTSATANRPKIRVTYTRD